MVMAALLNLLFVEAYIAFCMFCIQRVKTYVEHIIPALLCHSDLPNAVVTSTSTIGAFGRSVGAQVTAQCTALADSQMLVVRVACSDGTVRRGCDRARHRGGWPV
jgi:hypothetical protein